MIRKSLMNSKGPLLLSLAVLVQPTTSLAQSDTVEEVVVFGKDFVPPVNSSGTKTDTPPIETPAHALGVGFGTRYKSSTFSDDLNTMESPSFTLYDAAVHYEWRNMRVALNVQNLADKEYASSCFTRFSVLCTVGETRSIRGSFRYRW